MNEIYTGDVLEVLKTLESNSVDMVITSPPYWALRDYGIEGQLGLEPTFNEYIEKLCIVFDEVKRLLKPEGSCWVNLGDTYSGSNKGVGGDKEKNKEMFTFNKKPNIKETLTDKCLVQIPSRFAIAMCDRGWILRNEIIWHKPNAMPSSVADRFTVDYEKLFFFTKNKKYYFKQQKEPMITTDTNPPRSSKGVMGNVNLGLRKQDSVGRSDYTGFNERYVSPKDLMRNKRSVWVIPTQPTKELHFATFPEALIETPIKACCPKGGVVLDPFFGSGTTGIVAKKLGRNYIGIDLNPNYVKIAEKRLAKTVEQLSMFDEELL